MIFYFTGTGNSLYVAKKLLKSEEKLISISKEMSKNEKSYEYKLEEGESVIFVYPVYAWAPPKMVIEFIEKMKLHNYNKNYISTVITCGENVGNTVELFSKLLNKQDLHLCSGFSVVAPSNYVIVGNVDSKEIETTKLLKLDQSIEEIDNIIVNKEHGVYNIEKGNMPKLLTNVINPFFNKYARNVKKFYANDNCTGCKLCEKVCNGKCIEVDKKPSWSGECTQCLACINYCPTKAIQYGNSTIKKERYTNPNIKAVDMF